MSSATARLSWLAPAVALGLALAAAVSLPTFSDSRAQPGLPPAALSPTAPPQYQGAASCSVAGCHGNSESKTGDASAYRIWLTRDPHARAFAVLREERSRQIAARLAAMKREPTPPHEDARCLNCHVHPDARTSRHTSAFTFEEGVSCESCHGPAERWVEEHWSSWKTRSTSNDVRASAGMIPTKDLGVRASLCAGCHVGDSERDVSHDLIAAGHPRLSFEYSAFTANLPRHWDAAKDQRDDPDHNARAWVIGQLASARAALGLLAWRAEQSVPQASNTAAKPHLWPEFAEYSCFACHHDLTEPGWSTDGKGRRDAREQARWGTWYYVFTLGLAGRGQDEAASPLALLRREMSQLRSNPVDVARQARLAGEQCREAMERLVETERITPDLIRTQLERLADDQTLDWDGAAQLYLAAAARMGATPRPDTRARAEEQSALNAMLDSLRFRSSYDSPKGSNRGVPKPFHRALEQYLRAKRAEAGQ